MPRHDPIPPPPGDLRGRMLRILRLLILLSLVIGALSAAIIAATGDEIHIHMLVATALGTGLSVLLGGALMTLVFLSARSGHDDSAGSPHDRENEE